MRITFVYPPNRNIPSSPYGALPLLSGCVGAAGHEACIVDANLEVFERIMRPEALAWGKAYFDETWARLRALASPTPAEVRWLQALASLSIVPFEELLEGERAVRVLRDPELFRDPALVNGAYDTIANVIRGAYCLNPIYNEQKSSFCDEFFDYLEGPFDNPISQAVEEVVLEKLLATEPDVVAVTIPFNEQLVEAFSLLKQLKRRAPELRTMVGGAIISAYHGKLCRDERFYGFADFGMPGESDESLPRFLDALAAGEDLRAVPNLYHRDRRGTIHAPAERSLPDLNQLPSPDFSSVPVGRYMLPVTVVNYQTSRGCYYGKCTFCSFDIKSNFRFRKADLVAQDVEHIQEQTGTRHFIFWDPLTPPRLMRDVARWNRERGDRKIFWGAETKFEKVFTDTEFTDLLYEGGARFLQFGFESGVQRILDLMVKGNDLERVDQMLGTLQGSGIAVSVQWFIGFPHESPKEARESFRYLEEHRRSILLSSYMGKYSIVPNDDVFESKGDLYDIEIFQHADGTYDYRYRDGGEHWDRDELHAAYTFRGDSETVTRMAFYVYLTEQPERARELSNFARGGALPDTWEELREHPPRVPEGNFRREYDFDVFTPPEEQGIPAAGGALPRTRSHAVFVTRTQDLYPLTAEEAHMLALADGSRTAEEIVDGLAAGNGRTDALRERMLEFVRRGVLQVPRRVPAPV